jgi:hypothetical protein
MDMANHPEYIRPSQPRLQCAISIAFCVASATGRAAGQQVTATNAAYGIAALLHRSVAEILAVMVGVDPWTCGRSFRQTDFEGAPDAVIKRVLGAR